MKKVIITQGEIVTKGKHHITPEVDKNYVFDLSVFDKDKIKTSRVGDDLEIKLPDGTIIVFDDYYNICEVDECSISFVQDDTIYDYDVYAHAFLEVSAFSLSYLLPLLALGGGGGGGGESSRPDFNYDNAATTDNNNFNGVGTIPIVEPIVEPIIDMPIAEPLISNSIPTANTEQTDIDTVVDESFSLNFNDFFTDIDGDIMSFHAKDIDGNLIKFGATGTPFEWLSFNPFTGELTGTPNKVIPDIDFKVYGSDQSYYLIDYNSTVFTLKVAEAEIENRAPELTKPLTNSNRGMGHPSTWNTISTLEGDFRFDFSKFFKDPDGDVLNYDLNFGVKPANANGNVYNITIDDIFQGNAAELAAINNKFHDTGMLEGTMRTDITNSNSGRNLLKYYDATIYVIDGNGGVIDESFTFRVHEPYYGV